MNEYSLIDWGYPVTQLAGHFQGEIHNIGIASFVTTFFVSRFDNVIPVKIVKYEMRKAGILPVRSPSSSYDTQEPPPKIHLYFPSPRVQVYP